MAGAVAGCADVRQVSPTAGPVRIAAFDSPEGRLLAQIYAAALRRMAIPVTLSHEVGPREVVLPALQEGLADLVPAYAAGTLQFFHAQPPKLSWPRPLRAALRQALSGTGLTALLPARADDVNGVVVRAPQAQQEGWKRVSDLAAVAPDFRFGGPPGCADGPFCVGGLASVYGMRFAKFVPMRSSAATVAALDSGAIDVGMLTTTDPALLDGDVALLADDRHLQPPDNVTPIIRRTMVARYGARLTAALDDLAPRLTTNALVSLNAQVAGGADPSLVAQQWIASLPHGDVPSTTP